MGAEFCYHCNNEVEITLHAQRYCPLAIGVWLNMVGLQYRERFSNENLQQRMNLNIDIELGMGVMKNCSEFWESSCHSLWYWRRSHDSGSVLLTRPWLKVLHMVEIYDVTTSLGWIPLKTDVLPPVLF